MSLEIKVMSEVKSRLKVLLQKRMVLLEALMHCDVIHKNWAVREEAKPFNMFIWREKSFIKEGEKRNTERVHLHS